MRRQRPPSVRIFAGQWKRRHLEVPASARPTSGRAREALFSILQKRIPGARVLDLYAGSGAVGMEAVSRGAEHAVLIDRDATVLRRNIAKLPPAEGAIEILEEDADAALDRLASRGVRFDLVFSDPPYARGSHAPDLRAKVARVLAPEGIFVLQSDRFEDEPSDPKDLHLLDRRDYGRNVFLFFARDPAVHVSGRNLAL
jgi:16S rRNA (guanine966-N2)-methyltransferase